MEIIFENMSIEHKNEVIDIFNYYVSETTFAYPDNNVREEFYLKLLDIAKTYPAFIIKDTLNVIIGFCMLKPHNILNTFKKTAEITYFIKKEYTGKGVGKLALKKLEDSAKGIGVEMILASISSENKNSISFHKKNGFIKCGVFENIGRKFNRNFSVVWMQKKL